MAHNQQQQLSRQVAKTTAAATLGGSLIFLSGLTMAATVVGLVLATPVLVIFSPVLVPALIAVSLIFTGFLTSAGSGATAAFVLYLMFRYVTREHPVGPEHLDRAGEKLAGAEQLDRAGEKIVGAEQVDRAGEKIAEAEQVDRAGEKKTGASTEVKQKPEKVDRAGEKKAGASTEVKAEQTAVKGGGAGGHKVEIEDVD